MMRAAIKVIDALPAVETKHMTTVQERIIVRNKLAANGTHARHGLIAQQYPHIRRATCHALHH